MDTGVAEVERKYDVVGGTAVLDAMEIMTRTAGVAAVSLQNEQLLGAVYYDTADLRLIGAGITLRRRTGGQDAGWHLKLPAGAGTRDEIRLPLAGPGGTPAAGAAGGRAAVPMASADDAVPGEFAALVRAYTRGVALTPVVRIQISRRVLRLLDGASQILAEIAADHVLAEPAGGIRRHIVGRDRGRAGRRRPRAAEGDRPAVALGRRPARRRRDHTAAGAGWPPGCHRGRAGPTAADQTFARRRGGACLRARPGGRNLPL